MNCTSNVDLERVGETFLSLRRSVKSVAREFAHVEIH